MAFGWLGTFREGSWQSFRSFVLAERRDVALRVMTIDAEIDRIGRLRVIYAKSSEDEKKRTEQRLGISVTEGSALGKLLQAYIAMGGNPFDISHFFIPDTSVIIDGEVHEVYPYGGVVYPKTGTYNVGSIYEGGYLTILKYIPERTGGRREMADAQVALQVDQARRWVNQEIQEKRNDIASRIIKQCDLREQLIQEKEELAQMVGGTLGSVPGLDTDQFEEALGVARLIAAIDAIFYVVDDDGRADFDEANADDLPDFPWLILDHDDEANTAI